MNLYVRTLCSVALTAVSALVLSNCVVRAQASTPTVYASTNTAVVAQPAYAQPAAVAQPVYAQPAAPVCGACVQGSYERCNGCDDNCNGVIDEDCH